MMEMYRCYKTYMKKRSFHQFNLSVPVSSGRTVIKFHANQPDLLSFNMDQPVKIFSKGAGRDRELWGVEVSRYLMFDLNTVY